MTTFCIITVGRNCAQWLPKNIEAIASQNYPREHIRVAFVDDASTDDTATIMSDAAIKYGWDFKRNERRIYGVGNQFEAIHSICRDDNDVIVFVDADDWLNGPEVLNKLAAVYADPEILLTYGRFISSPPENMHRQPKVKALPPHIVGSRQTRAFERKHGAYWNHLRTFRYGPFKEISASDIRYPSGDKAGQYFHAGTDTAIMVPMLELVGCRYYIFDEPLLVYNTQQAEPDWRTHKPQISETGNILFAAPVKPLWRPTPVLLAKMEQLALQVPVAAPPKPKPAPISPKHKMALRRAQVPKPVVRPPAKPNARPISAIHPYRQMQRRSKP